MAVVHVGDQWDSFLEELKTYISTLAQREDVTMHSFAEDTVHKIEIYLSVLSRIIEALQSDEDEDAEVRQLLSLLTDVASNIITLVGYRDGN